MLKSFGPRTVGPIRTLAAGCIFPPQRCRKTLTARDRQTVTTRQTYGPRPMLHAIDVTSVTKFSQITLRRLAVTVHYSRIFCDFG